MAYSYRLWKFMLIPNNAEINAQRIQTQTWLIIVPSAILQLGTGFTMISINHEDLSSVWISGSIIGFITVIGSWFSFVYFLLMSQQLPTRMMQHQRVLAAKLKYFRRAQSIMLFICTVALLSMVFLMANKVT
jgi:uncharacterized membrane protein